MGDRAPTRPGRARAGRLLLLLPLALMALIATTDIIAPADIHLGPLLVVAPAITASFAGPRATAAIGALSVVTLVSIGATRGVLTTENLEVQIASLVLIGAFIVVFAALQERRDLELERARTVSEATQRVLLRPLPTRAGPLRLASEYYAATVGARIGGDLYAAARTQHGTRLVIGDVRGKGLETLGDAALLLGAFHAAAHRQSPLPELAASLEDSVSWGLAEVAASDEAVGADIGERFVTAVIVDILDDRPLLQLISCGHPPPLLLHEGRAAFLEMVQQCPPLGLGLGPGPAVADYPVTDFRFERGDVLLLYTDGLIEARDGDGRFYPLQERVEALAAMATVNGDGSGGGNGNGGGSGGPGPLSPAELMRLLTEDLQQHLGGPVQDDTAMIAVIRSDDEPNAARRG
ncbi:PP2C family protein-serine/threonine phosphatase [Streptacidiphilus anmyonensis]|uniref:PP2C family protein-serine/threonine phosphatase n=1 Tax=Streptacidiphilus anmyonensis TaxID=405782 RepID=UPI0005A916D9|nr:PP2C family protein-serine/threonine phosphatase [Streptacidiphilus anmyonensis]